MDLDWPTRRRFLRRLLAFVDTTDEVIDAAIANLRGERLWCERERLLA